MGAMRNCLLVVMPMKTDVVVREAEPAGIHDKRSFRDRVAGLRTDAEQGHAEASFELGCLLEDGLVDARGQHLVPPDLAAAVAAYQRAVELGDLEALLNLGVCYDRGNGVRRNRRRALLCYSKLWKARRYAGAATNIATVYRDDGDLRRAFQWLRRAASTGSGDATADMGYWLYYGIGVRRDVAKARSAFHRAAQSRDISDFDREEALYLLAVAHLDRSGLQNRAQARALLTRANADGDYPEAGALVAQLDLETEPVPCRCRRGLDRHVRGQAPCDVHRPRLANQRLQQTAARTTTKRAPRPRR